MIEQTPNCDSDLTYTVRLKDSTSGAYKPLPGFISHDGSLNFFVFTADTNDEGHFQISILASVDVVQQGSAFQKEFFVELTVAGVGFELLCKNDVITPTSTIDD